MHAATETFPCSFESTAQFLEHVLSLRPRIAVFDFDGTLWPGDAGEGFFRWSIARGMVSPEVAQAIFARYDEYLAGRVGESEMCGEMVQIYAGWDVQALEAAAAEYVAEKVEPFLFREFLALTKALIEQGTELWAVSSTNIWVIAAGCKYFGIPAERVLAVDLEREGDRVTDRLVHVPSGPDKAVAIRKYVKREADAVFGNSVHDLAMLEMAKHPFAVNPNVALQKVLLEKKFPCYWPEATRGSTT